ncbi:MAG: exodeoxyribonuclease III [Chloroflexaceae bacterium]|jgi:exodeoxyribonuclease-3|nr:exodeoxyribonuclease III [Chloroflexaceae bacterium]
MTSITIYSWNVNGIRSVERKGFPAWLGGCGGEIVALQEVKAEAAQLSAALRQPPGYHVEWLAAVKKGYSGVATFSRHAPLAVSRGFGDPRFDHEGRVLVCQFPHFTLFNIYFPSGSSGPERVQHKLAFYDCFLATIGPRIASGEPVVVVGDVNTAYAPLDLARPRENARTSGFLPEERAALGQFFAAGLVDSFRHMHPELAKYSWWSQRVADLRERNIGWRLDYIFVSPNLRERIVAVDIHCDVTGSDHCPVSVTLDVGA